MRTDTPVCTLPRFRRAELQWVEEALIPVAMRNLPCFKSIEFNGYAIDASNIVEPSSLYRRYAYQVDIYRFIVLAEVRSGIAGVSLVSKVV